MVKLGNQAIKMEAVGHPGYMIKTTRIWKSRTSEVSHGRKILLWRTVLDGPFYLSTSRSRRHVGDYQDGYMDFKVAPNIVFHRGS